MMKKLVLITFAAMMCVPLGVKAQKKANTTAQGHEILFTIQNSQDEMVYLAVYYRDKLILKDSTKASEIKNGQRQFLFKGNEPYQKGLYKLVSQHHRPYLDFIMDKNQKFSVKCDTIGDIENIVYTNSPENLELHSFQAQTVLAQKRMTAYHNSYNEFEKSGNKDSADFYKN